VLERLHVSHGIGAADDTNFDYILDSILDHAERSIALCSTLSTEAPGGLT
jgi:hypothetical protein